MSDTLRLFVAVEVPEQIVNGLSSFAQEIGLSFTAARWVAPANMHLTLKFLGPCPESQLEPIIEQLKKAATKLKPFTFSLATLGAFPTKKRARVFWAGVSGEVHDLISLAGRCDKFLAELGFERESRDLHPHLTLARFKTPQDIREALEAAGLPEQITRLIEVKEIALFQSLLSPKGPTYKKLTTIPLKA